MTDFQKYTQLRDAMRDLIRAGKLDSEVFQDAWNQSEAIKSRHGGLPPMPDGFDYDAHEMEFAEMANMEGTR